jgi:uncharacterized membrane protein
MKWILSLVLFAVVAFGSHYVTVRAIPGFIMSKAQNMLESQGAAQYQWVASPRQTPQTQRIVRPSPDLSYAICRFDVSDGPVLISAPGWDGYGSLSIFDDQTNNVFVANLDGEDASVVLLNWRDKGISMDKLPEGTQSVFLKDTGIAVIRRLAPIDEDHAASADLVSQARCEQISWP